MIVLALSSGTSADAIDVAVAGFEQSGDTLTMTPLGGRERDWPDGLGARIRAAYPPASTTVGEITALDNLLGQAFAAAAVGCIDELGIAPDLIVSHGQTVFHWVEDGVARGTLQLGEPAWIAEATGLPVLSNVRSRDIAAGGQGAPLASTFDALWLRSIADQTGADSLAAVNLGGIANVTVWTPESVAAYDTGPANCLIDATVAAAGDGRTYDIGGLLGASGSWREDLLERLLADPYFARPAPKSTGREHFHAGYVEPLLAAVPAVSLPDLVATLTELTARTVADQLRGVDEVVASGGGVRNPTLMRALASHLVGTRLTTSGTYGVDPQAKEAYLFTLLGYLSATGQPGTAAAAPGGRTTTGAEAPRILGVLNPGNGPLRLPPPAPAVRRLRWRTGN